MRDNDFYRDLLEESGWGYAYHKIVTDERGLPVDYTFIEVNTAFEQLTGLNRKNITGRNVTEILPGIRDGDFDWVSFYGEVALHGGRREFEQYSKPLGRYYRGQAYSPEKGHFITLFTDITAEMKVSEISKAFLDYSVGDVDYQGILDNLRSITGAKYVSFNLFEENGRDFITAALSGVGEHIRKAAELLGFPLSGKKWSYNADREAKIAGNTITRFETLADLTGAVLPKKIITFISATFGLGPVFLIKITKGGKMLGDFTLLMPRKTELKNQSMAEIFAAQTGLFLDRMNMHTKLLESRERLSLALEGTGAGLWDWDMKNDTVYFSTLWKRMLGYKDDEVENSFNGWKELWHPEDVPKIEQAIDDFLEGKTGQYHIEHRLKHKNGDWRWILTRGDITRDDDENPVRWTGTNIDLTERRQIEQRLASNEKNFRTFFETMDDMIFVGDRTGNIFFSNAAVTHKLGYTRNELSGMHVLDVHSKVHRKEAEQIFADMFAGTRDFCPLPLEAKDGMPVPVETRIWFGEWDGRPCIFGISKDLSKEQEALQKFNKFFDRNPALMAVSSIPERRFTEVNEAFIEKLGYAREEIIGKTSDDLGIFAQPEKQQQIADELDVRGKIVNCELKVRAKSGEVLDGLFSGEIIESEGKKNFLTVMIDITERERAKAELEEANRRLEQQTALARQSAEQADRANKAKSEFLANMSHEIRTPMNGVVGFTDLLLTTELTDIQRQYMENVQASAETLMSLINDILDFSKIEADKLELDHASFSFREQLERAIDIVSFKAHKKELELLLNIDPELPVRVNGDPVRLTQVLTNLLGNAVKFTQSGEVELSARCVEDVRPDTVRFFVRDTGIGMTKMEREKIFDSFTQADASTTRKYGGSGLGLSISKALVEKMGGELSVKSIHGKGSTFSFILNLPVAEGPGHDVAVAPCMNKALIVDDNDTNRKILGEMVAHWGIEGIRTGNGIAALEMLQGGQDIDCVLMDYHMPYMNGVEVTEKIRKDFGFSASELPVVLIHSSSEDPELLRRCRKVGIDYKITKPVKMDRLREVLLSIQNGGVPEIPKQKNSHAAGPGRKEVPSSAITVLVAEDNLPNMILTRGLLKKVLDNVIILEAKNGKEAVELFTGHSPDLVLMDVQMPELDGFGAVAEIRRAEKNGSRHTPIVALTAGALEGDREKCLAAGMDDYLTKPIMIEPLRKAVKKQLEGA